MGQSVITYVDTVEGVTPEHLDGFFVGWAVRPTTQQHLELLRGSYAVEIALSEEEVVGFATAISDGVLCAFIPLVEVRSEYQGEGIGSELVHRLVSRLGGLYMVDVCCDAELEPFYRRFGFGVLDRGMGIRRPDVFSA